MTRHAQSAALLLFAATTPAAHAFVISTTYLHPSDWTPEQKAVVAQAITDWTARLAFPGDNDQQLHIAFDFAHGGAVPGSFIAQWSPLLPDVPRTPDSPGIIHFIYLNADFLPQDSFSLAPPTPGDNRFDMLTAVRHELGHALGFAPGVYSQNGIDPWLSRVSNNTFDPAGLNVPLSSNNAHTTDLTDLMYFQLARDTRKEISDLDVAMLSLSFGYAAIPEPASLTLLGIAPFLLLRRRNSAR